MTNNIFRMFKPGSQEDRVEKRRAQLRQAQQTYRDRKTKYARVLEEQVARTKRREAELLREVRQLRTTLDTVLDFIGQQGVQLPDKISRLVETQPPPAKDFSSPDPLEQQQSRERRGPHQGLGKDEAAPGQQQMIDSWPAGQGSLVQQQDYRTQQLESLSEYSGHSGSPESVWSPAQSHLRLCDLDLVVVGMEFVLTIEGPCLEHLHGDPDKPDEPGGHALTASSQILSMCPLASIKSNKIQGVRPQDLPIDTLDALLSLSSQLCSDREVTPVQAWHYIRHQPHFGGLEAQALQALAVALRDAVKCHGFGAVVDQVVFQNIVADVLFSGRPF